MSSESFRDTSNRHKEQQNLYLYTQKNEEEPNNSIRQRRYVGGLMYYAKYAKEAISREKTHVMHALSRTGKGVRSFLEEREPVRVIDVDNDETKEMRFQAISPHEELITEMLTQNSAPVIDVEDIEAIFEKLKSNGGIFPTHKLSSEQVTIFQKYGGFLDPSGSVIIYDQDNQPPEKAR